MEELQQDLEELEKAKRMGQQAVVHSEASPTDIVTDALYEIAKHYLLVPKHREVEQR